MSEFLPAVLAALLAFGASSALAQTSSLPPLPELRFVEIPAASRANYLGDRWSYMEAGRADAPPVVLLHGVGANSMHWRFQLAGLSDRYRVIAWNAPGYVLSDALKTDSPDCKTFADALKVVRARGQLMQAAALAAYWPSGLALVGRGRLAKAVAPRHGWRKERRPAGCSVVSDLA